MRSLWSNIFRRGGREEQDLHELLGRIPLFERLSRRELQAVAKILYRRQYKAGEYVFHQGDIGIGMYIIERGSVAILYEPTEQLLTALRDGDFFGEVALLNETRRSAAARADTETTLLCMLEPDLEDLGARNPRIGFKVLSSLARIAGRRLIAISDEYEELRLEIERQDGPTSEAATAKGTGQHVHGEAATDKGAVQVQSDAANVKGAGPQVQGEAANAKGAGQVEGEASNAKGAAHEIQGGDGQTEAIHDGAGDKVRN